MITLETLAQSVSQLAEKVERILTNHLPHLFEQQEVGFSRLNKHFDSINESLTRFEGHMKEFQDYIHEVSDSLKTHNG